MKIRKEQMDTLDKAAQVDFHHRLITFLRDELPEETVELSDGALLEQIVQSEERALTFGIETELGITQFVILTLTLGPNFDDDPAIRACLKESGSSPDERLNSLVEEFLALEEEEDAEQ